MQPPDLPRGGRDVGESVESPMVVYALWCFSQDSSQPR